MQRRSAHKKTVSGPWRFTLGCGGLVALAWSANLVGYGLEASISFEVNEGCVVRNLQFDGKARGIDERFATRSGFHWISAEVNGVPLKTSFTASPIADVVTVEFSCEPADVFIHVV